MTNNFFVKKYRGELQTWYCEIGGLANAGLVKICGKYDDYSCIMLSAFCITLCHRLQSICFT